MMSLYRGLVALALFLALAGSTAQAGVTMAADPGDGGIVDGVYQNPYFGIRYPLLSGWTEDRPGLASAYSGEYSLIKLKSGTVPGATLDIRAQDQFFRDLDQSDVKAKPTSGRLAELLPKHPLNTALGAVESFHLFLSLMSNVKIERPPTEIQFGERRFARIDFSISDQGIHAYFVIITRCHTVSLEAAAPNRDALDEIVSSLHGLAMAAANDPALPTCSRDYATPDRILDRVEPDLGSKRHLPAFARIVIAPDGTVGHVHVIAATPEQRGPVEAALAQWKFVPSGAVAVETRVAFPSK